MTVTNAPNRQPVAAPEAVTRPPQQAPEPAPEPMPELGSEPADKPTEPARVSGAVWLTVMPTLAALVSAIGNAFGAAGFIVAGTLAGGGTLAAYAVHKARPGAGKRAASRAAERSRRQLSRLPGVGRLFSGRRGTGGSSGPGRRGSGLSGRAAGGRRANQSSTGRAGSRNPLSGLFKRGRGASGAGGRGKTGAGAGSKGRGSGSGSKSGRLGRLWNRLRGRDANGKPLKDKKTKKGKEDKGKDKPKDDDKKRRGLRDRLKALRQRLTSKSKDTKDADAQGDVPAGASGRDDAIVAGERELDALAARQAARADTAAAQYAQGGTVNNPFSEVIDVAHSTGGRWSPENARRVLEWYGGLESMFDSWEAMLTAHAKKLHDEFEIDPGAGEQATELGRQIGRMRTYVLEAKKSFERAHDSQIDRLDNANPNGDKWDISKNRE